MATTAARPVPATLAKDDAWKWLGTDDRGIELEVVAIETAEVLLVIHVMPTQYRR